MSERVYNLDERLLIFARDVIRLVEKLPKSRAGNHVAGQLLRSGTSPLSNHGEAQGAESKADFIHKMSLCLKELRETERWLKLVRTVPLCENPALADHLLAEVDQLIRIFKRSLQTAAENPSSKGQG